MAHSFDIPLLGGFPVLLEGGAAISMQKTLARAMAHEECELAAFCFLPERLVGVAIGPEIGRAHV